MDDCPTVGVRGRKVGRNQRENPLLPRHEVRWTSLFDLDFSFELVPSSSKTDRELSAFKHLCLHSNWSDDSAFSKVVLIQFLNGFVLDHLLTLRLIRLTFCSSAIV